MKIVLNIIVSLGIILILVGVTMFFYGVHMFTARGDFSNTEKSLAEISLVFWIPVIFGGLVVTGIGFIIKGIRRGRISVQKS